jgi:hypothetical protein
MPTRGRNWNGCIKSSRSTGWRPINTHPTPPRILPRDLVLAGEKDAERKRIREILRGPHKYQLDKAVGDGAVLRSIEARIDRRPRRADVGAHVGDEVKEAAHEIERRRPCPGPAAASRRSLARSMGAADTLEAARSGTNVG